MSWSMRRSRIICGQYGHRLSFTKGIVSKIETPSLGVNQHRARSSKEDMSSYMSKGFNYTLSKLKLYTLTLCSMKSNNFYEIVQFHCQVGLVEQLICKVSFTKDVMDSIDNSCSNYFCLLFYIHFFKRIVQL